MKICLVYLCLFVGIFVEGVVHQTQTRQMCSSVSLKNGKVRRRSKGRFVKFICNPGYLLAGEKHSTCVRGTWDPSPPKCVRATCMNRVQPPTNGLIYPSHSGAALHFFCKPGFTLNGPTDVYCDGRQWDNNAPICIPANTKPQLACNFEKDDLCGWTHDLNHDFDWRRENFNTPSGSIGTGPSFDHTKGAGGDGYYMYIESSSRNENDTARLISPVFDKIEDGACLEFFYHMFGTTTGTLRVYLKMVSEKWNFNPKYAIFSKSGNQGDKWYRSLNTLGSLDEEFQIIIEGVRGPGYVSDTAIDDVRVIPNCTRDFEEYSSTTTEENNTEVGLIPVQSCESRCGQKESTGNDTHYLACDCDDYCFENNRCCPDFFDVCVIATTAYSDYSTTTDMSNEINLDDGLDFTDIPTTIKDAARTEINQKSTMNKFTTTEILHPSPTTSKRTRTFTVTTREKKTTAAPRTSVTFASVKPSPKAKATVTKFIPRVHIQIQTRPTTLEILRKTVPSTTKPRITTSKINQAKKPLKEADTNDVMELPKPINNDEALLLTSPLPYDDSFSKEYWSDEIENRIDAPHIHNFSETNKLLSVKGAEVHDVNVVLLVVSVVGAIVISAIVAVVGIRRYRSRRIRKNFSNGDSQSDVRFLTSDEILDFSMDKDYDEQL